MALQIPSGLITGVSGGGITSGTVGPLIAYPIPVVIVGANGASASGNHSITDTSGILNVNVASGVAVSISGNVVLVVSGGTVQVSGTVGLLSGSVQVYTSGSTAVVIAGSGGTQLSVLTIGGSDAQGAQGGIVVSDFNTAFNGSTWDRMRSAIGASGMAAASGQIFATAITAVSPGGSGQFMPLNATSGILSIGTSGSASVAIVGTQTRGDIDALGASTGLQVENFATVFNGTSNNWDRMRSVTGSSGGSLGVLATQVVGYSYSNPTGAAITNIKSGAGFLHAININQTGGSGQQVQIRDSASGVAGTLIGTIAGTASGAPVGTLPGPVHLLYDLLFTSGLVISTSGTLWDLTVTWRTATS